MGPTTNTRLTEVSLLKSFKEAYPYISCQDEVILQAIREVIKHYKPATPLEQILDLVADGILSQGLADEVEE